MLLNFKINHYTCSALTLSVWISYQVLLFTPSKKLLRNLFFTNLLNCIACKRSWISSMPSSLSENWSSELLPPSEQSCSSFCVEKKGSCTLVDGLTALTVQFNPSSKQFVPLIKYYLLVLLPFCFEMWASTELKFLLQCPYWSC